MPTKVNIPPEVQKEIAQLKRKYPAITQEVRNLLIQLENDERPGDKIPQVGYNVYKVRLKNPSARRGKSGGFRVIYYVRLVDNVILVTIYSKTEQNDISPEEIRRVLEAIIPPDDEAKKDEN